MKRINIAELLKDCPRGMELDCAMYDNLYFDYISNSEYSKIYPIHCYTEDDMKAKYPITFTSYGRPSQHDSAKCVIFPKGKTTWEGFVPPGKFKDGDIFPNKFDVTTLKPLQPVLVRDTNGQVWTMDLFSHKIDTNKRLRISFACVGHYPNQCIPFEGNEHLLGTTDDCDEYYKIWE